MSSAARITASTGPVDASLLDDRLAGDASSRSLAAEPGVDGRPDVGELALVDAPRSVLALDVRQEQRMLAGVVGRGRRRVAAVVGGEDQKVARAERVEEVGQATVEVLQARSEEHTSELQSRLHLVCRLLLEKKK